MAEIRVLRLMEYTYPDLRTMADDMGRWTVGANSERIMRPGHRIKSAVLPLDVLDAPVPGELPERPVHTAGTKVITSADCTSPECDDSTQIVELSDHLEPRKAPDGIDSKRWTVHESGLVHHGIFATAIVRTEERPDDRAQCDFCGRWLHRMGLRAVGCIACDGKSEYILPADSDLRREPGAPS